MYIDADIIIKAASLLGAIGALIAAIVSVYKVVEINRRQSEFINAIQKEQQIICYGLRGALQGLVEAATARAGTRWTGLTSISTKMRIRISEGSDHDG